MNIEVVKKLKQIEAKILDILRFNVSHFVNRIDFSINLLDKEYLDCHYNDNYSMYIYIRYSNLKIIQVRFYSGYIGEKPTLINNISLEIINQDKKDINIKDYCTFRNIPYDKQRYGHSYRVGIDPRTLDQYIEEYLSFAKSILELDEMQKILYTDYWIDVPIDYSPYK
ncbi:MAG: hypothetical protein RL662_645 [Bacteroidota bacterium]